MAKSYKKFPIVKQEKVNKKTWNRRLRRKKCLFQGAQYKKCMPNYNTWQYIWTEDDARRHYTNNKKFYISQGYPTVEDFINNYWKKCCYRK